MGGASRRGCILSLVALTGGVIGLGPGAGRASAAVVDVSSIQALQAAVVNQRHQPAISGAQVAVTETTRSVADDTAALAADRETAANATATRDAALSRLGTDQSDVVAATTALEAANVQLANDRAELRALAVGLYTGQITNPQPASVEQLEANQQAVLDTGQIEVVARVVVTNVKLAEDAVEAANRTLSGRTATLEQDQQTADYAASQAVAAASRAQAGSAVLAADQNRAAAAQQGLAAAQTSLQTELAALAGPTTRPGLSVLGGPALDANQLARWYNAQGYVDLTPAPIQQLAAWYIQDGRREGVRGDVAFAQAVLETGGFGSPDSIELNNYAGIGHCDTCATGWDFPSPQGGVDGQLQLLEIFAGGAPPDPIAPVLASLVPGRQTKQGCCSTWDSLTGVWATDPIYGSQIVGIYQQMLRFGTGRGR
ncbi:MAG: glucosaminidase domain-containing protein [Acidimicrobiales bacterium]|nr:glucosaminidase domain-containing protein [Acidimicrobiales bacterium]